MPTPLEYTSQIRKLLDQLDTALAGNIRQPVRVPSGGNLQLAINQAIAGDSILLESGGLYVGNFTLPVFPGTGQVTITADGIGSMAGLKSPNAAPALATLPRAHGFTLQNLIYTAASPDGDLLTLGDGSKVQNVLADVPRDFILDGCVFAGSPTSGQKRGLALNCGSARIIRSRFQDLKRAGQDSQAIAGWNGPGPYTVTKCALQAAGENIIFGGADASIPNLVPADILILDNDISKPMEWYNAGWQVKNLLELKNARRVQVRGNRFANNWANAQDGMAILFTPRNQDGSNPWTVVEDVIFDDNDLLNIAGGIEITGSDNNHPSQTTRRIKIRNNNFRSILPTRLKNDLSGTFGLGRLFLLLGGPEDVEIAHITASAPDNDLNSFLTVGGMPLVNFLLRDSILPEGWFGIKIDGGGMGMPALTQHSPGSKMTRCIVQQQQSTDPIDYGTDNLRATPGVTVLPSPWLTTDGAPVGANL